MFSLRRFFFRSFVQYRTADLRFSKCEHPCSNYLCIYKISAYNNSDHHTVRVHACDIFSKRFVRYILIFTKISKTGYSVKSANMYTGRNSDARFCAVCTSYYCYCSAGSHQHTSTASAVCTKTRTNTAAAVHGQTEPQVS